MSEKLESGKTTREGFKSFVKELKEFALTVGEPCPEGHRREPGSNRCLPIGSTDHTAFTRSVNVDDGPQWRGLEDKQNQTFASEDDTSETALDAEEMEELQSCGEGTTFSFVQRRCVTLEEAEAEDHDGFAVEEGQSGHEDVVAKDPEGRRDPVGFQCPVNTFFDYKLRECIPLNKDTVLASENAGFSEDFKKAVAMLGKVAKTSPDPIDGHTHFVTVNEEGNGMTSVGSFPHHSHEVENFEVIPFEGDDDYVSQHPGVVNPMEMNDDSPKSHEVYSADSEEVLQTSAAPITTKQRKALPTSSFGVPRTRGFPLDSCARVRNAMARFNQAKGLSSGEKATLRRKILAAAKKCGIQVRNFAKASNGEEFTGVLTDLLKEQKLFKRIEMYKDTSDQAEKSAQHMQGPCPPGMVWDKKSKRCMKMRGFVEKVIAQHSDVVALDPEGRRDPVGFQCPPGSFFDFTDRKCVALDPSQKPGTTTTKADVEEGQSRVLTPQPKGKPARLSVDCPKGTIWDSDLQDCKPLDSRKKTKSAEEEAQGKCAPDEFMNPITKKCMPKKSAFKKMKSAEEVAGRDGLTPAPEGKVRLPMDCPEGTVWDGAKKVCKELDSMDKSRPGGQEINPEMHASVDRMSTAQLIKSLDDLIKEEIQAGRKEKAVVMAKDLPNAAFPPSLVSTTRRSLMHHSPSVEDPYDNASVDVNRLRNALARSAKVEGFSTKAVEDAREHLVYHAREIVKAYLAKKA